MIKLCTTALFCLALLAGCTAEAPENTPKENAPAENQVPVVPAATPEATAVVHDVMCGCSIDGVGKCGNYIKIDGKYVPMIHGSLGKMEFCSFKDKGAKVETMGAMKDGKFVAENWKLVQ